MMLLDTLSQPMQLLRYDGEMYTRKYVLRLLQSGTQQLGRRLLCEAKSHYEHYIRFSQSLILTAARSSIVPDKGADPCLR